MLEIRPAVPPTAEIIYNPGAGKNRRKERVAEQAARRLLDYGYFANISRTEHPGHATELARDAALRKTPLVFAMGGDGTVNEVARGLIGSETVLGVLPQGTVNVYCRETGIPRDPREAVDAQLNGSVQAMDAGMISLDGQDPHYFFLMAGIGYDGLVFNAVHKPGKKRKKSGQSVYAKEAIKQLRNADTPSAKLIVGEGDEQEVFDINHLSQMWATNTRDVAKIRLHPDAQCDDGLFAVTYFDGPYNGPIKNSLLLARDVARKALGRTRPVRQEIQLKTSHLKLILDRPISAEIDGEPAGSGQEIDIVVVQDALRVLSPQPNSIFSKTGTPVRTI